MCNKEVKEWVVNSPWGRIAVMSWGNPEMEPVLLLHGYMDTAATFTLLVDKLPDNYYYVGFDIPGHGKSDPFPEGILISKLHAVEVTHIVVESMKWNAFTFISHSMSCVMGLFYNYVYPGRMKKMIFLDPKPALAWYYVINHHADLWYQLIYSAYYDNYQKINFGKRKSQPYESWIDLVSRTRSLTRDQTKIVLSRSLKPADNGNYQLTWEQRVKTLAHVALPTETLQEILTSKLPPTLVINASNYDDFVQVPNSRAYSDDLLKKCENTLPEFHQVTVMGSHNFHITNVELMIPHIENFLKREIYTEKCKL